jgi:hypothetical protein
MWVGETPKNVAELFRIAGEENAVLLFDEADSIAARRSTSPDQSFSREANAVVNVLLKELESFRGVVIFATNLAANFDPAFERRIRTQVLFEMPDAAAAGAHLARAAAPTARRCMGGGLSAVGGAVRRRRRGYRNAVLKAATAAGPGAAHRGRARDSPAASRGGRAGRHRRQARHAAVALCGG